MIILYKLRDLIKIYDNFVNDPIKGDFKVTGAFVYSIFIGLCSVTSNMTSYFDSYNSIKLINCGAPQRDALNGKMMF